MEYKYIVAVIYSVVLFLDRMDVTIVNVAMPTFANAFQIPITQTEWIALGFLLSLAIMTPISGWMGDKYGNKRIFVLANLIFTFSSLLCALSWNLSSLVLFRILQGVGGGMILPVGMSMVYRAFSPKEYPKVANYTLMSILVAPAIAPTIGGVLVQHFSWHWIFLINVPIGIASSILSFLYLQEDRPAPDHPFDFLGALFSAASLSLLLYAISYAGRFGLNQPFLFVLLMLFLIAFSSFIYVEKKSQFPLIDLKFFKIPLFVQSNIMQVALQFCYFGSLFLIAIYFQIGLGMSPEQSGLAVFTQPIGTIMMLSVSAKIFQNFGPKLCLFFGMLGISSTTYWIFHIQQGDSILWASFVLWIRGLMIGMVNGPLQASTMLHIERHETGRASSIFNAIRQIGMSLGISVSSLFLAVELRTTHSISKDTFHSAFLATSLVALAGSLIALTIDNKKILQTLHSR